MSEYVPTIDELASYRANKLYGTCTCMGMKIEPMPCDWCEEYYEQREEISCRRAAKSAQESC